jgi:hypothetical protein
MTERKGKRIPFSQTSFIKIIFPEELSPTGTGIDWSTHPCIDPERETDMLHSLQRPFPLKDALRIQQSDIFHEWHEFLKKIGYTEANFRKINRACAKEWIALLKEADLWHYIEEDTLSQKAIQELKDFYLNHQDEYQMMRKIIRDSILG